MTDCEPQRVQEPFMPALPSSIYLLVCLSFVLSLGVLATDYYNFRGHTTFLVGTTVSVISIILHATILLYHHISTVHARLTEDSLASWLPFVMLSWSMVHLWLCTLASMIVAQLLGLSSVAHYRHSWLGGQKVEFCLILAEVVNVMLIAMLSTHERRKTTYRM
ncbi:hypothetical protein AMATHDRAFT_46571 [Amanita thiersii Skay4041]|uniref:Uncharacterized protein n=1 Tax=Amanita thiersii Skay4041 TaxID=703135 RepID=A0A2A9NQ22_9AGAR|nr:hypothetical protein AMATHDRAFT_46571 [Amanita thiersii Skay4041]